MRWLSVGRFAVALGVPASLCLAAGLLASAQSSSAPQSPPSFTMSVPVDEVGLTFHAADANGLPVNDLNLEELRLLDNGRPPHRVLAFYVSQNHPIRAGILMDTSESMRTSLPASRTIAARLALQVLRQPADRAFVMEFAYTARVVQPWTPATSALAAGIRNVASGRENPMPGTAIFDTLYRACLSEFGAADSTSIGNFIVLFTDGEDTAGKTSLENVVTACQQTNTAIYAFRSEPAAGQLSTGPGMLADLAQQTGGRVFSAAGSQSEIDADLRILESDLRNQYRLIYKPAEWSHDGAFHHIALTGPSRAASITVRSGYYAPVR